VKDKFFGKVENRHYSCLVDGSGELENIFIKKTGKVLFEQPANGLAASLNDGSEVEFKINPGETSFERGPVYDLFKTGGNFAESSFKKQIRFYREISRIDFKITFNFINQQIGDFFLEEKKLCATWPVGSLKTMKHDIPFGAVKAKKSRPLYALNWLNIEMESGAFFTLLPKGKIKFFEKDGILYNLLAWGDEGVDFMRVGGTCSPEILQGHFDLRLNGEYVVEYALYIHENKPLSSDLFKIAYSYSRPFIAVYTRQELKAVEDTVLKFQNSNVSSTSVIRQNNKIVCRFFETDGMEKDIKLITDSNVIQADITDIYGRKVKKTSPFRIAHLNINRREN
jgi:alpha-mannosidase